MVNMLKMMKQAAAMQESLGKVQAELAQRQVEFSSGGGMVTATVNGKYELLKLSIDPSIVSGEDVAMVEDLVVAAVNEAFKKAGEAASREMSGMLGGLGGLGNIFG